jgi:hypothetical protein
MFTAGSEGLATLTKQLTRAFYFTFAGKYDVSIMIRHFAILFLLTLTGRPGVVPAHPHHRFVT